MFTVFVGAHRQRRANRKRLCEVGGAWRQRSRRTRDATSINTGKMNTHRLVQTLRNNATGRGADVQRKIRQGSRSVD